LQDGIYNGHPNGAFALARAWREPWKKRKISGIHNGTTTISFLDAGEEATAGGISFSWSSSGMIYTTGFSGCRRSGKP
jgi:hypothetical protein